MGSMIFYNLLQPAVINFVLAKMVNMKLMIQLNSLVAATLLLSQAGLSQTVKPQEKNLSKMDTIRNERNAKAALPLEKKFQLIKGSKMAYMETGAGDPIVFLHGNPTSSYIWRNIIPYVQGLGRCIAPDLPGMGDSEKLQDSRSYTFELNAAYLDSFLHSMGIKKNIIFVVHDWGSALAFDWTRKHPDAVKGIVYMEAIVKPKYWNDLPPLGQEIFKALRSEKGEQMVLQQNSMIEVNLVRSVFRHLTEEELNEYRRPFAEPGENRRVMLNWARQLPIEGQPANIIKIVSDYGDFLSHSKIPKLFIEAKPGTLTEGEKAFCGSWPNQVHITLPGHHHLQEDVPNEIGTAISVWIQGLRMESSR